ncbi:MAG TPA: trypsin-like peptidase domain-containing protein [Streptosporangiaceae bacterium]|jgi:S1-C subfamily serine protease|nr:trypsin-like peptidase domain-containing protein [Streptosporangiaceae bacterium]
MTMTYDPPAYTGTGQAPPGSPWHGPEGPGGPGGPYGYGGGGQGPGRPVRRWRHRFALATVAVVAGLGTFFGLLTATASSHPAVLTTAQIAAQTDPGLVDIVSNLGLQQAESAGTGLVLTPSGEILTNNHVIKGATAIRVRDIGNGRTYAAKVVGYDQSRDIAVIQLVGASGLQTAALGDSSTVKVGNKVIALGNALGKGGTPSVAVGHVAGLGASIMASDAGAGTVERLTGLIHHTAPIQPGDSGGPLVSNTGKVIGIDTAASASSGFQFQSSARTQAFAIPINAAVALARQIEAGQASATIHIGPTGLLGVGVQSADQAAANGISAGSGAVVQQALPGTPAARAGITGGDVIVAAGGHRVSSPSGLQSALERFHPGNRVSITWTDQFGQAHSATLVLANGPAQ